MTPTAPDLPANWLIAPRDLAAEKALADQLGLAPLVANVLISRGISDPIAAYEFFHANTDSLHDPTLLPDFEPAANEILGAIERKERIYIHGDYDVDGITSAALLARFLRKIGGDVVVHVPHRIHEGYGVHESAVQRAVEVGAKLLLTCDCGIQSHDQVRAAHEAGLRVVITDHHEPGDTLPEAEAVVNPHRIDSQYPYPHLSGVGVAFKLCQGLTVRLKHPLNGFYRAYLDLAAIGTVADVMPLTGENRLIVKFGLPLIASSLKPGIRALLERAKIKDTVRAYDVAFRIGPRLNAVGRMDDAKRGLELLLSQDDVFARQVVDELEEINNQRREAELLVVAEAMEIIEREGYADDPVLVVAKEGWHPGLIGLAAGRLNERFCRPSFVLGYLEGSTHAKCSARALPGFHLKDAIDAHSDLVSGGGHERAAGFSIAVEDIDEFRTKLIAYALQLDGFEPGVRTTHISAEVQSGELTHETVHQLSRLEPFGEGNPEPRFLVRDVTVHGTSFFGTDRNFLKLEFRDPSGVMGTAKLFSPTDEQLALQRGDMLDVVVSACIDSYNGYETVKWTLHEISRR